MKIIEDYDENNDEFSEKILKSIKRNKKDKTLILARKLGKHCKRESTEKSRKNKTNQKKYIYKMIKD